MVSTARPVRPLRGILDEHEDGTYLCIKCVWCHTWHCAPAADDMAPGHVTHLMSRCTVPESPYRETGYSVRITRRRTRRSRSCLRGGYGWTRRARHGLWTGPRLVK